MYGLTLRFIILYMGLIHIVSLPEGHQVIVRDFDIEDGMIKQTYWDDYDCSYTKWVPITIDRSYFLDIHARFIMNPNTNEPMGYSVGQGSILHLAYTYSVILLEYDGASKLYGSEVPLYTENGIGCSTGDMYCYHRWDDDKIHKTYDDEQLVYEVEQRIDWEKILLPDQQ